MIAGLRSDFTSTAENMKAATNLEHQLNNLHTDLNYFTSNAHQQFFYLNQSISDSAEYINQEINATLELLRQLMNGKANLLSLSVNAVESSISELLNNLHNNVSSKLQNLNNTEVEEIGNASNISLISINILTDRLASGIQDLHTFDSCAAVSPFPIQLPSGIYNIKSGDTRDEYCSTIIAFPCNSIPGRWTRIGYLIIDENPMTCPGGLEIRSDTSNPPLC